jgi:AraC family transcriptional regulator of adaptative response/methylated-DNA-[protein]-cysteine methyltransferase
MQAEEKIFREVGVVDEDIFWQAVQAKDARFDGLFVYAVRSTGIYCKPSCPSRLARRDKTSFFAACADAEACGFRACLRCRPRSTTNTDPSVEMALRVCRSIEARAGDSSTLEQLGAELGVSPYHVQRTFKSVIGVTPRRYAAACRLKRFKSKIKEGWDVTGAMYESGYGSSSRLYERASQELGMTPATYRRGGEGMNISYTIVDCSLGRLLVAATERGMCSVQFGDTDDKLAASLAAEYPKALIRRDGAQLDEPVEALLRHLDGSQPSLALPLDLQATTFQLRVWEELRRIPYGETRSYKEIADGIGQPTATRAVARACAANPVAIITPCHRVVRGDGSLSGYRWGVERKRALLEREGADSTSQ